MGLKTTKQSRKIIKITAPVFLIVAMLTVGLITYKFVASRYASAPGKALGGRTSTTAPISANIQIPVGLGRCHDVAVTGDGKFFTVAFDKAVAIFSTATGDLVRTLDSGSATPVAASALSRDGRRVVTATNLPDRSSMLLIWDSDTGELIFAPKSHSNSIDEISVTADGALAVSLSVFRATLTVWDLTTGESDVIYLPTDLGLRSLAITRDGTKAYVEMDVEGDSATVAPGREGGSAESHLVEVDLVNKKLARDFGNTGSPISSLAISPDSQSLVSGQWDGNSYVWDLRSGRVTETLKGHTNSVDANWVAALSFGEDGVLASGSWDGSIRTWRLGADKPYQTLKERNGVESAALAPDAQTLVSCLTSGIVHKWKLG